MAALKFLIVPCLLLLVQAQAHPQTQVKSTITDIIQFFLPDAENFIDWVFDASGQMFHEAAEDPVAYQLKSAKRFKIIVKKFLDWTDKGLDLIIHRGSDDTSHFIDCIKHSKATTKEVFVGFYNRTTYCMAPDTKKLMQKLEDAQPYLRKIKTRLFVAANKIQDCHEADDADCISLVIGDILDVLRSTRSKFVETALDIIMTIIDNLEIHIPKCVSPNFEQAKNETLEEIDSITLCITS